MGNKPLNPLVIVAVIAAAVLLFGIIGWKFVSGGRVGSHGEDLSKPAAPPPGMGGPPQSGKEVQARHVLARIYGRLGQPAFAARVSARAAQLFTLQQRANVMENQRGQRFLEPAYHQSLARVYRLTGQQGKAAQEERMLSLLRRDPQGAARSYRDYQASLARALGGAVQD